MNTRITAFPQKFFESAPSALDGGKNIANDIYNNYIKYLSRKSREEAAKYNIHQGNHNGQVDAHRHAYSSAFIVYHLGRGDAEGGGELNELVGDLKNNQPLQEKLMDDFNNRIGREIGARANSLEEVSEMVAKAVQDGVLQNDVNTPVDSSNFDVDDWYNKAKSRPYIYPEIPLPASKPEVPAGDIEILDDDFTPSSGLRNNIVAGEFSGMTRA